MSAENDPAQTQQEPGRQGSTVVALASLGVVLPVAADLLTGGRQALFRYQAADAFYYHTVARRIAEEGLISFDGEFSTNGFHPLWQAVLALLYRIKLLLGGDDLHYVATSVVLGAVLLAGSTALLGRAAQKSGRILGPAFLTIGAGPYALLLLPPWLWAIDGLGLYFWSKGPYPLFGTLWSYVNGMESGILLGAFGLLAWAFVGRWRSSVGAAAILGFFAALLTLARLDHVFFGFLFPLLYGWEFLRRRERLALHQFLACGTLFALPILLYMAANQLYAGALMPVSGGLKTTFPFPNSTNFRNLWAVVAYPFNDPFYLSRFFRSAQIVIPGLAALIFLAREARRQDSPDDWDLFLRLTALGVLILAAYNFLFVRPFAMGYWYTPVSVTFLSLWWLVPRAGRQAPRTAGALFLACFVLVGVFLSAHRRTDFHWLFAQFYLEEAPAVREFYAERGEFPRILETDDGIIAFATRLPMMSAIGLMLDTEAARAMQAGTFDRLRRERGYHRAALLAYYVPGRARPGGPHDLGPQMAEERADLLASRRKDCPWEPEYVSESGNFLIVRCPQDEVEAEGKRQKKQ